MHSLHPLKPVIVALALLLVSGPAPAQSADLLNFQARLNDAGGVPIQGPVSITVAIYDVAQNGAPLWSETQTVTALNGVVNALLGTVTGLPTELFDGTDRWMGIDVNADGEMVPRALIASTPYARHARSAGDVPGADITPNSVTINGIPVINSAGEWVGSAIGTEGPAGPPGADGAPGPQGAPGAAGALGPQGPTGPAGLDGAQGSQGPAGPAGIDGAQGSQGPAGPAGIDGAQGPMGPAGIDGVPGVQGPTGPAGIDGAQGPPGADGLQGPPGLAGLAGLAGPAGPTGPQGLAGLDGAPGVAGATGPAGPAGPTGPAGAGDVKLRKTSNESVTSSTTVQNDDHLFFAIGAGEVWIFDMFLTCIAANGTPDAKFGFSIPSGATIKWSLVGPGNTSQNSLWVQTGTGTLPFFIFGGALADMCMIRGIVVNGATPGTVQLQWAQNTSNATATTIEAQSYLQASKL